MDMAGENVFDHFEQLKSIVRLLLAGLLPLRLRVSS